MKSNCLLAKQNLVAVCVENLKVVKPFVQRRAKLRLAKSLPTTFSFRSEHSTFLRPGVEQPKFYLKLRKNSQALFLLKLELNLSSTL